MSGQDWGNRKRGCVAKSGILWPFPFVAKFFEQKLVKTGIFISKSLQNGTNIFDFSFWDYLLLPKHIKSWVYLPHISAARIIYCYQKLHT